MKKIKIMTVFGTRPEAIKMAPLVLELKNNNDKYDVITVVTAQHREMLDQVLEIFKIRPDYDLDIMKQKQTLEEITNKVVSELGTVLENEKPNLVLVHGDTTTTFAASLSAFYKQIPIGHVEAGLRTWDKYSPFPEEMNRQLTDDMSDLYFAPTQQSKLNLKKENHKLENIFVTGNTAIDALKQTVNDHYEHDVLDEIGSNKKIILVTMHRRENQGDPMRRAFRAIKKVVDAHDDVEVIYPVHMNPIVREIARDVFQGDKKIHLINPLDVVDFHNLAARSYFIMTDSGGVQEEAPSLSKPVLVLREETERPEGVKAGTLKIVGTDERQIKENMEKLLLDDTFYKKMATAKNPYGDGNSSKRIVDAIDYYFDLSSKKPTDF